MDTVIESIAMLQKVFLFLEAILKADPQIADTRFKKSLNIYNEKNILNL